MTTNVLSIKTAILLCITAGAILMTAPYSANAQVSAQFSVGARADLQERIAELRNRLGELQMAWGSAGTNVQQNNVQALINRDLSIGSQGDDVTKLQELLATDPDIYPEGLTTGYYGELTERAIVKFQERHELAESGQAGESTRALLSEYLSNAGGDVTPGLLRNTSVRDRVMNNLASVCERIKTRASFCDRVDDADMEQPQVDEEEDMTTPRTLRDRDVIISTQEVRGRTVVSIMYPDNSSERFVYNTTNTTELVRNIAADTELSAREIVAALGQEAAIEEEQAPVENVSVIDRVLPHVVREPSQMAAERAALIVIHGGNGSAEEVEGHVKFTALGEEHGFVVVYPDSSDDQWNDYRPESDAGGNDVRRMEVLINFLKREYDLDKVFVTGISNGGMLTMRLACELSEMIDGFAPVAANMPTAGVQDCDPQEAKPMLLQVGTEDNFMPYEGGEILNDALNERGLGGTVISAEATADLFSSLYGCSNRSVRRAYDEDNSDNVTVDRERWFRCDNGVAFEQLHYVGGGHVWYGRDMNRLAIRLAGEPGDDVSAEEEIVSFFGLDGMTLSVIADEKEFSSLAYRLIERNVPYTVREPRRMAKERSALFVLHGGGGNAERVEEQADFTELGNKNGFMVVYPDSDGDQWNDYRTESDGFADDVRNLSLLADMLRDQYNLDNVYVTGISNGGMMAMRLACEAGDAFDGYAPIAATMPVDENGRCNPDTTKPLLLQVGTADKSMPFEGGEILRGEMTGLGGEVMSYDETIALFYDKYSCFKRETTTAIDRDSSDGVTVDWVMPRFCRADGMISSLIYEGAGHTWFGQPQTRFQKRYSGPAGEDVQADEWVVDYFNLR